MTKDFDRTIQSVIGSWAVTLLLLAGLAGLSVAASEPAKTQTIASAETH